MLIPARPTANRRPHRAMRPGPGLFGRQYTRPHPTAHSHDCRRRRRCAGYHGDRHTNRDEFRVRRNDFGQRRWRDATNADRREHRAGETTVEYSINQITGALTAIGTVPTEVAPSALATDPQGKFLYVTNQARNTISI